MSRIIIFTGKGGVGKTSIAAAHARKAALMGKKSIIVSVDMAHNLSDLFEMPIGREITKVEQGLYALEVDPDYEMENDFQAVMSAFDKLIPSLTREEGKDGDPGDLSMFPGMEELFSLLKIQALYESGEYDVIIVDCAPTGETLSLLKFPELLSWYIEKLFPIGKVAMKVLRPIGKKMFQIELPDGKAMNDIERLYVKLTELQRLMKDKEKVSIRLVAIPEKMVVEETKRNYMYLNLYNYNVDGLFINRILPKEVDAEFFGEWVRIQASYIQELENTFGCIPISRVKWYDSDINGLQQLDRLVQDVMTEENLFEVRNNRPNEVFEKNSDGYSLTVHIPFAQKEEVKLHETGSDIILRIGNFKRCIPVPDALRNYCVVSAKMKEEQLVIRFEPSEREETVNE